MFEIYSTEIKCCLEVLINEGGCCSILKMRKSGISKSNRKKCTSNLFWVIKFTGFWETSVKQIPSYMTTNRINRLLEIGENGKTDPGGGSSTTLNTSCYWCSTASSRSDTSTWSTSESERKRKSVGIEREDNSPLTIRIWPCTIHAWDTFIRSISWLSWRRWSCWSSRV